MQRKCFWPSPKQRTNLPRNYVQTSWNSRKSVCWTARSMERSIFFFLKIHISAPGERNWSKKSYFSDFSSNIEVPSIAGKIRKVWFFAPGCLNNCGQGWSFSVILAWDNQKGTFLTHFVNFGHEGAPNVTKLTYNILILWENSIEKKIGAVLFTGGWAILFKKKKYGPFHWSCSSTYVTLQLN